MSDRVTEEMLVRRCTFRRDGVWCGRPPEDEAHPQPGERMGLGRHVWRHDKADVALMDREPKPRRAPQLNQFRAAFLRLVKDGPE